VIVLRYTEPDIKREFRIPLNIGKFPVLPMFGLVISAYMAIQFEMEVMLVGFGIITIGAIFYVIFNRKSLHKKEKG
jgi:APA family basic amino acid/polyamine antiporter